MRIGFLITYFYPTVGGAENNCFYLARELAKRHEVHVFCSGSETVDETIEGIKVHRVKEVFRFKYYFALYPQIIRKMQAHDLDILHVHGLGFIQHDIALRKLKKNNPSLRIVCTPHGPFMALKKYNLLGTLFKKNYTNLIRKSLRDYDLVLQVNPRQHVWMTEEYGVPRSKIKFLPNGITSAAFKKSSTSALKRLEKKYELNGKFVISYVGRIQNYKGLDQVLRALPELLKKKNNLVFVMMGRDAGDTERLTRLSQELGVSRSIRFTGEISEEDKRGLLSISEIFVFPSEWEAFGIGALEAMAQGNVIMSSKTEGGLYLVREGVNGYLFTYGNLKELERKMETLIASKNLRRMQVTNIKKSRNFLWNDIAKELEGMYKVL